MPRPGNVFPPVVDGMTSALTNAFDRKCCGMTDCMRLWKVWLGRAMPSNPPTTVSTQNAARMLTIVLAGSPCREEL